MSAQADETIEKAGFSTENENDITPVEVIYVLYYRQ